MIWLLWHKAEAVAWDPLTCDYLVVPEFWINQEKTKNKLMTEIKQLIP